MDKRFQVALSFPGEHRTFIKEIALRLAETYGRHRILYDAFYEAEFARPDLDIYLQDLYRNQSELVVVFLCEEYQKKEWTGLEWRAIREIIKQRQQNSLMLIRLDDTPVPGIYTIDGSISVRGRPPETIASLIEERVSYLNQTGFGDYKETFAGPDPLPPLQVQPVVDLENSGAYGKAVELLESEWSALKSWENLIHYLRLLVAAGGGTDGLDRVTQLQDSLTGDCPLHLRMAKRYFLGRVQGQLGFRMDALSLHNRNAQHLSSGDLYTLKSQFEVGQLLFRIEDFHGAKDALGALRQQLSQLSGQHPCLEADLKKFLATFEVLHVVFDVPGRQTPLQSWTAGDYRKCLEFANQTLQHAANADYVDAQGWGYTVRAFGNECCMQIREAREAYEEAENTLQLPGGKRSSLVHSLLYRSAFERRNGHLDYAVDALERCQKVIPNRNPNPYQAALLEQRSLVAASTNSTGEAISALRSAISRYAVDTGLRYRLDWPIVKRLRTLCDSHGWELKDFFASNPRVDKQFK